MKNRLSYKNILLLILFISILFFYSYTSPLFAGSALLSWNAPSTNEDGTPLTDLAGYKIYYGTATGNYTYIVDAGNVTTYTFTNLTDGLTYYFVATSYNAARLESSYSNEVSKIIPPSTQTYTMTVSKAGTGTGTVTSSPAGINCGSDCSESYVPNAVVNLTATPDSSATFGGWSGACTGTGTCPVTMSGAKNVTATFNLKTYTIKASSGTGGSISPNGTVPVNHGANQLFTITANSGYSIANVLVDNASVGAIASYTFSNITAAHTINASFAPITYPLTVSKAGTGSVNSSPAGINCGSDCSESYAPNAVVTLTATPDSSATFTGWSGACSGTGTCSVTMDAAKSVTATFALKTYAITASAGTGGSISPNGTVPVNYGSSQSFTITPDVNYTIGDVLVDGVSAGAVTSYSFANVNATHTISVSCTPSVVTDLPKSGQTSIYASGDDGNIQAGVEWPVKRFTDNGDGTLTDGLTGLMWLKDGGCLYKKSWSTALTTIVDFSGSPAKYHCAEYIGSYSDWRLPNMREIESLMNLGVSNSSSWLNSNGFKNVKSSSYWVSTSYAASTTYAWMANLMNGTTTYSWKRNSYYILAVRSSTSEKSYNVPQTGQTSSYAVGDDGFIEAGLEWPTPRFTDNKDGTVTDNLTGLMWLKDGGCIKNNWSSSLKTIAGLNNHTGGIFCIGYTADHTDWRLPNVKELDSLVNYGVSDQAGWLNSKGFTNVKYSTYWSSTTSQMSGAQAWMINMQKSAKLPQSKQYTNYAWPVRGGNVDRN